MEFDFDRIIDRTGTNAIATDGFRKFLFDGEEDVVLPCPDRDAIAMWVADMAFASAPAAIEAMRERLAQPIFGYTVIVDDGLFDAFSGWCERHYGWVPEREHFLTSPGIVPALYDLVEHILETNEKVLTLSPAYGPFELAAKHHGRELVTCGLRKSNDGHYTVDFADLEKKLADTELRLFFLCHPHNPTGRTWGDDELRRMAELCFAHEVIMVSDEIHCDLLRSGLTHTPLAKLFPESDQIITCMSSSKTFNLAGLGIANVIIPNDEIRGIWVDRKFPVVNPISAAAATGVFRDGDGWLTQLRSYLDGNFELVGETLADRLPDAVFRVPDATYLAWIDLRAYFPADIDLTRYFAERTGVLVEGGHQFVADADGHIRINLACPRSVVEEALARIVAATLP
ncbi:MAG: putative C-S lyase [Actinomycetia bacterium]|nr:putative C-S lyase [Actinomycetes bacterium]